MGKSFSLADLIPESITFRDVQVCPACGGESGGEPCVKCNGSGMVAGERYEAKTTEHFGAVDYARYDRMMEEFTAAMRTMGGKGGDKTTAAAVVEQIMDELMNVIIPDLPKERIKAMAFGHKFKFLEWWRTQQPEPPVGESRAGKPASQRRRSPASSGSTRSTRSGS